MLNVRHKTWAKVAAAVVPAALLLLASGAPVAVDAAPRAVATAVVRYVVPSGNDGSSDCALITPCQTVQRAVAVAQAGDEIHVAVGTYGGTMFAGSIDSGVTAVVIITTNIAALRGGYSTNFAAQDPQAYPTVLSAAGAPGAYVLLVSGQSTLVDGFTLSGATGACSPGCGTHYPGGAVRLRGGAPTLRHNRITGNVAYLRGGGIYVGDGAVATIEANVIEGNSVDGNGGGVFVQNGNAVISGNQILSNIAVVEGGGIYIDVGVPAVIRNNAIGYNQATNPVASRGAGVRTVGNTLVTISHNDVYSNTLFWGGGAGLDVGSPAIVDGNSIHHNSLHIGGWGGALILAGVTLPVTVTNNLVYANHGSGVQSVNSTRVAFVNNTVANNVHVQPDSGTEADAYLIWFDSPPGGPVVMTVYNNVLAGNEQCGLFYHGAPGGGVTSGNNDSWNNHSGAGNYCEQAVPSAGDISANPLFAGGADFHLQAGSPALNIGTSTLAPARDKDCVLRPQGGGIDLGAYERIGLSASRALGLDQKVFLPLILLALAPVC